MRGSLILSAPSQALVAGVDAADESLLVDDSEQEGGELIALFSGEGVEQRLLMIARHFADFSQGFASVPG